MRYLFKYKRLIVILATICILFGLPIIYSSISLFQHEAYAWYDTGWAYRRPIAVSNPASTNANEQILIEVDTAALISANKLQIDCDDLRFIDSDDSTLISYWVEGGCNTTTTQIWVKIPLLNSGGETIYMYYGNPSAANFEETWTGKFFLMKNSACDAGWTTESNSGGSFYQRFPRGAGTFGGTGGSASHGHGSLNIYSFVTGTPNTNFNTSAGNNRASSHRHSISATINSATVLPAYNDMIFCSNNDLFIKQNMVIPFQSTLSAPFSQFTALNDKYPRGNSTYGGSSSSSTHNHILNVTSIGASDLNTTCASGTLQAPTTTHTHPTTNTIGNSDFTLPYRSLIYGQASSNTTVPPYALIMADSVPPLGWFDSSYENNRFPLGSTIASTIGGSETHNHTYSISLTSTGVTEVGCGIGNPKARHLVAAHTHSYDGSFDVQPSILPPYINVLFLERMASYSVTINNEESGGVAQPPVFTSITSTTPVNPGGTLTFNAIAGDPDGDTVKLVVCKTSGVTGEACDGGAGDTLCTSSLVSTNPSCAFTIPSVAPDTSYNSYPYIFDSTNLASLSPAQGTVTTYNVNNMAPVVSNVTINGGSAITLIPGNTKPVSLTATITDNNSCYGSEISEVKGYAYRSGIGYGLGDETLHTYYFDGSGGTFLDPNSVWTNGVNIFDTQNSTIATTSTQGNTVSNFLRGYGTNAPASGNTITGVRARLYNDVSQGSAVTASIYTASLAQSLGTITHDGYEPGVGDYIDSNVVGYWKLDETSNPMIDSSGHSYNGTSTATTSAKGKLGNGQDFNGATGTLISIGDISAFETTAFTIDAYIKKEGTCNFNHCTIFSKGSNGLVGYGLAVTGATPKLQIRINDGGSGFTQVLQGNTTIANDTWYHVAATFDQSTDEVRLYLNGQVDGGGTFTETINYGGESVKIGNSNSNSDLGFNGVIDEVRFSNKVRTGTEISNYYNQVSELSRGAYASLSTPTGGWDWTKLNNLETKIYKSDSTTNLAGPGMLELEVTTTNTLPTSCNKTLDADDNNCYPEITCSVVGGSCTDNTDASANYTCTTNLQYFAEPTDTETQYPEETWLSTIKAVDNNSESRTAVVPAGVELNSLIGYDVTSSIDFGFLNIGEGNDPLNRTTTITPTGNVGLDQELSGSAYMCTDYPLCVGDKISVDNQKYSLTSSTAYSAGTALSTTPVESLINILKPTNTTPETKNTWWGLFVPQGTNGGIYEGAITISGIKSDPSNWGQTLLPLAPDTLTSATVSDGGSGSCWLPPFGAYFRHQDTSESAYYYEIEFLDTENQELNFGKTLYSTPVPANTNRQVNPFNYDDKILLGAHGWKIRMWDSQDNVSPWSATKFVTCSK